MSQVTGLSNKNQIFIRTVQCLNGIEYKAIITGGGLDYALLSEAVIRLLGLPSIYELWETRRRKIALNFRVLVLKRASTPGGPSLRASPDLKIRGKINFQPKKGPTMLVRCACSAKTTQMIYKGLAR
jgi:hypothetical protein